MQKIRPSEITPEHIYFSRREFLAAAGALLATTLVTSACGTRGGSQTAAEDFCNSATTAATADELGNKLTTCTNMVNYNNYYEFTQDKDVAPLAQGFRTSPWTVAVGGLVNKPGTYSVDDLKRKYPPEERVYRMRCDQAWSAVVPWLGFPLARLLRDVGPTDKAKYVRFTSVLDPKDMPGQQSTLFPWPYIEGLRLDEAMNDLTLLVTGIYGKPLPPQEGAPIRLVVPW
ncbi:MAG: protein-methionine-sulfoxide reductase catalytic subunit MsrP, partial [Dehalococcoidales bacterium]|nr:protein-methionine-sulfoxide reductase catalytic subunit MsrP [Dehalococcoidales bacterium]